MNIAAKTSRPSKMASAAYFRSALKLPRPTSEFVAAENAYRKESCARRGLSGRLEALKIEANIDNPSTAKIPTPGTASFKDQTGGGRHFEKIGVTSAQPAFTTAGPISRTCADFNGITSQLIGASISNFVGLSSGFVICSGYIDAINANNTGAGNAANNDILWVTTLVICKWHFYPEAHWPRIEFRVVPLAGSQYCHLDRRACGDDMAPRRREPLFSVNGGIEASVASGNTINDLTTRKMCLGKSVGGYLDRKIFELATFSTVPSAPERDTVIADFMAHIGAV
ncbi:MULTISPECIES: hypothetical protein [unclassified Mesorhizobium]|uniref:hypothetical protein n=1 Tax=unclassified Mesorhizobium TaxID=325217 RepID=UPI00333BB974